MRTLRLALAAALVFVVSTPAPAMAGENTFLGDIVVSGASLTNVTTAAPFVIPPGTKLTLYTTASGIRCVTDQQVVTAAGAAPTRGIPIPVSSLFPTSVGESRMTLNGLKTALVACIGTGTVEVWARAGTE